MKIWIQLQKWFQRIVYAYAVISSPGNLSTLLRNGTSEGVDFMRWGRKDGRTDGMGALLCRYEGQVVYLPTCLPISFLLRETYLPTTMGLNPFKSSIPILATSQFCPSVKVEKILKGSLDLIPSPSPSIKIQILGTKVCLRCKSKTWLGVVYKILKTKSLLTSPSNILPYYLK